MKGEKRLRREKINTTVKGTGKQLMREKERVRAEARGEHERCHYQSTEQQLLLQRRKR